jgi:hypothetical protein
MRRKRDRISSERRGLAGRCTQLSILALVMVAALGLGCKNKKTSYFLTGVDGGPIDDIDPSIAFLGNLVHNDDKVCINVTDQGGSGLDQVTAMTGTTTLPVTPGTAAGDFNIGISGAAEGAHTIQVTATDNAGNQATGSKNVVKDVSDPTVGDFNVPASQSSNAASLTLSLSYRITDANFGNLSRLSLFTAGTDNQCGTGDDQAVPQGTSGGQADPAAQDVTGTGTGMTRDFTANFTLFNGVTMGPPVTRRFCPRVEASDLGRTCTNEPNPNTTTTFGPPFDITWQPLSQPPGNVSGQVTVNGVGESGVAVTLREGTTTIATTTTGAGGNYQFTNVAPGAKTVVITPPSGATCDATQRDVNVPSGGTATANFACTRPSGDFTVNVTATYRHIMAGSSETCAGISVNPAQPGGTWMTMWSGPGTVGSTTRSGTLDSGTSALDRQPINAFGTYNVNVTVTSGSITRMASGSVNVGAAQGTCTAPSSSRFKRDIVSLMPDGMTLLGLRPVVFRYLAPYGDPMVPQIGLIAEEVVEVFPEAVTLDTQGRPDGIYYSVLTRLVLEEIEDRIEQALAKEISRLVTSP